MIPKVIYAMNPDSMLPSHALCPCHPLEEKELIHPEDVIHLEKLSPFGRVFKILGTEDSYIIIGYGNEKFRVKSKTLEYLPPLDYEIGQKVIYEGDSSIAEVVEAYWHYKEEKPYYFIAIGGKPRRRRYWAHELRRAD